MPIRCEIVSQDRLVWEGDADIVNIPGSDGDMGILPNHAPLLATMRFGIINVRTGGVDRYFTVAGGVVEVQPKIITILADAAENVEEIDIARAEAARQQAVDYLESGPKMDAGAYMRMEASLRKSNLRLEAVRKYRRSRRDFPRQEE
ncbi:MAG TPA: ATP synthase F1 subunit epsilon [Anaerolineales bacterium]|nr:ATP synthase F1 subunit epsilon [Anaerolineales bacterium]